MSNSYSTTPDDARSKLLPQEASPKAIAEAMEDPEVFEQIARGDLYVQMHRMRALMQNPTVPMGQRMEYAKFLARMGKVEKPEATQGAGDNLPVIQIVLPNSGQTTQVGGQVIEHEDTE